MGDNSPGQCSERRDHPRPARQRLPWHFLCFLPEPHGRGAFTRIFLPPSSAADRCAGNGMAGGAL